MPSSGERFFRALTLVTLVSLLCLTGFTRVGQAVVPQGESVPGNQELNESTLDSMALAARKAFAAITNPQLEERMATRRAFQQRAYADILRHTLESDGLGALIAYCRAELRLEFFLPSNTIYTFINISVPEREDRLPGRLFQYSSGPIAIPLPEDRSFPADPWSDQ
jgi:hypothetical protein